MKNVINSVSIIVAAIAMLLNTGCRPSASHTEKVELNPYMDKPIVSSVNDLNAEITYIPLTENDAQILAGNAIVKYADDDNILSLIHI